MGPDTDVCYRTTPLSAQSGLSQITKRRLEFGVDVETFRLNDRRQGTNDASMEEEDVFAKRRRRLLDDERHDIERRRPFPIHRPQVMRQIDNENDNLIRETQVALKSLSGNWVRHQSPPVSSEDNDDRNGFDNLFDDKRSDKIPPSPSHSSESQRSFTYNDDNRAENPHTNGINENEEKCNRSDEEKSEYSQKYTHYNGANFDDLGDSSNELEIDCDDEESDFKEKHTPEMVTVNKQSLFNAYKAATAALPYSTQSAFKPPAEVKHRLHNPSLPSEPFGGYSNDHEKGAGNKGSKHYTVLQPAGVGSRAATALQEARTVPTVQPTRDTRPPATFSPTNSRGTGHVHLKQR